MSVDPTKVLLFLKCPNNINDLYALYALELALDSVYIDSNCIKDKVKSAIVKYLDNLKVSEIEIITNDFNATVKFNNIRCVNKLLYIYYSSNGSVKPGTYELSLFGKKPNILTSVKSTLGVTPQKRYTIRGYQDPLHTCQFRRHMDSSLVGTLGSNPEYVSNTRQVVKTKFLSNKSFL